MQEQIIAAARGAFESLGCLELDARIDAINRIREALSAYSPFASEPVDCVRWVRADAVTANDYNPNSVAPPEMKLLEHSITEDGYTVVSVGEEFAASDEIVKANPDHFEAKK